MSKWEKNAVLQRLLEEHKQNVEELTEQLRATKVLLEEQKSNVQELKVLLEEQKSNVLCLVFVLGVVFVLDYLCLVLSCSVCGGGGLPHPLTLSPFSFFSLFSSFRLISVLDSLVLSCLVVCVEGNRPHPLSLLFLSLLCFRLPLFFSPPPPHYVGLGVGLG